MRSSALQAADPIDRNQLQAPTAVFARMGGAAVAVAVTTAAMRLVVPHWHLASLSMLYIVVIQATAVLAGRLSSMMAALCSFLALNWYFLHPVGHWTVSNSQEWVVLMIFLITGLVTGQLAAGLRVRAEEARAREREMTTLYELSTATVVQLELEPILALLAARVGEIFGEAACEFQLWDRDQNLRRLSLPKTPSPGSATEFPLQIGDRDFGRMKIGRRVDGRAHSAADRRLQSAFAHHAALAIERFRLAREAHDAHLLRDSDALKTTLLSAVSHDLRTPLAGIKALTTTLLQEDVVLPPAVVRDTLEGIDEETDRMTRLVSDLLDLSRIEAGVLRPSPEPVLAADLIDDTLHRLTGTLSEHPLSREVAETLPVVHVDYVHMQQVLTNLLENAARYTPKGTPIAVGASVREGELEIWVADRGPGVPPVDRERVFDRFYRLENHETELHGTGMGLAISRGLVEAHGGHLWAEETPGGGATFRLRVPL